MAAKEGNLKSVAASSVRQRVSKEEWEMRCDLAAAYQLAALFKWTDLIYTHFSARVPGTEHLLINPYGLMFEEITASTLAKIDGQWKIVALHLSSNVFTNPLLAEAERMVYYAAGGGFLAGLVLMFLILRLRRR